MEKSADLMPKNFALIRLAEKTIKKQKEEIAEQEALIKSKQEAEKLQIQTPAKPAEDLCPLHQRVLDIICIQDRARICANCALFGSHKNHDIRLEQEVVGEITYRTELLITMY